MASFAIRGSVTGSFVAAFPSGQKPRNSNIISSNGYLCNNVARQSSVVPSMSWIMKNERRPMKLMSLVKNRTSQRYFVNGPKWTQQSGSYPYDGQPLESDIDFSNPFAPGIQIDLLNKMSVRSPLLEKTEAVIADQRKQRLRAFRQGTRDFVDGLVQYIASYTENYKYFITASKENANMIMEQGFISSSSRDEILNGLERIYEDIGEGKFKWRNNIDVRTNIIEALIEIVGAPAKRLDETISHYAQQLTVVQIWCYDSIDKIITQIEELQLELVLLAMRNEGLVLPCTRSQAKWIILGDLVLSKLQQLERNVSRLLSCKGNTKMNSVLLTAIPSGHIDDSKNSLFKDSSGKIHNSAIKFGNMIVCDIAYDLSNLERILASWMRWDLLIPNDIVTRNHLLLNKSMLDMDKFTALRSDYSIFVPVEDSSKRFLSVYKIIPEVLKEARDFVKSSSFNHENIQNFPHATHFVPGRARLRAIKKPTLQGQSDDTRRKLLDWLQRLQPARAVHRESAD